MKTNRWGLIATTCIGVLLSAAAIMADDHQRVETLLQDGRLCAKKVATNQAIIYFTEAARLEPKNPEPYYERGRAYLASGGCEAFPDDFPGHLKNTQRAIANYSEAVRLNPVYAEAYCARAVAYLTLAEWDKAITDCTRALELGDRASREFYFIRGMYVTRGDAYLAKGNTDKAFEDYSKACEWDGHACVARGKIFEARGEFDKAMADYDRAARFGSSEGFLARGHAYATKKQWGQAISDFTTYRAQAYRVCFLPLGKAYLEKGDFDKAIAECDEIIKYETIEHSSEQPSDLYCDPEVHRCRGLAYQAKGNKGRAEKDFAKAKTADSFESFRRGQACMMKRDAAGAIAAFSETIRLHPREAGAYFRRANAYVRQGDLQRAIVDYGEAIRFRPAKCDKLVTCRYFEKRGEAHLQLGDYDMAIADSSEAIRVLGRDTISVDAHVCRGQAYMRKGDLQKAIDDFSCITYHRDDAYYYRGEAFLQKGDLDKAIDDFFEAIRRDAATAGDAYLGRGKAYAERGDRDKATSDFTEVIDHVDVLFFGQKPRDAEAYYRRGLVNVKKGETEQAEKDFAQARNLGYEKGGK